MAAERHLLRMEAALVALNLQTDNPAIERCTLDRLGAGSDVTWLSLKEGEVVA
jgi:hypothetical protein